MLIDGSGLFAGLRFHPVIPMLRAGEYLVRDFTSGPDERPLAELGFAHDVGRYNERRPAMYDATKSVPSSAKRSRATPSMVARGSAISPVRTAAHVACSATSADEHAVSMLTVAPWKPRLNARRPEAIECA